MTALAGCSGSGNGGAKGEVVTNETDGDIEVTEMSLKNTTILGTEAVVAEITAENTTSETIPVGVVTEFYDGDTKIGTDEQMEFVAEYEVEAETSQRLEEGIEGRKDDVSSFEVTVVDKRQ